MKKLLSVILAVLMLCASSVTIYADANSWGGSCAADYYVSSSYSIYIPESINLNEEYRFEAEYLNITDDEEVDVLLTNLNNGLLTLTSDKGDTINVSIGGVDDNRIAVFTDNCISNVAFFGTLEGGKAGYYTGTLEFVFELAPRM